MNIKINFLKPTKWLITCVASNFGEHQNIQIKVKRKREGKKKGKTKIYDE